MSSINLTGLKAVISVELFRGYISLIKPVDGGKVSNNISVH